MSNSTLELVSEFQSGNRDAFAKLVTRYQNLVSSVAFANTGDLHRSEDIAQQTFLTAWQKQTELKDPSKFGAWVRSIANNLSRNERRLKENVQQAAAVPLNESSEPAFSQTNEASRKEQNELLWSTLDRIPIEYREPLVLYYREEKSVANVAEQMELSQDAVKQRLKRGRAMMKEEVECLVEDFLHDTRPSPNFSVAVLAMLPAANALASTSVKIAAAVGAKTVGTKVGTSTAAATATAVGSKLGAVSSLGVLGAIAGPFLGVAGGMLGGWFGAKSGAKEATSDEEASTHWRMFYFQLALSILFAVVILTMVAIIDRKNPFGSQLVFWVSGIYVFILVSSITWYNSKIRRLHRKHGYPESQKPFKNKSRYQLVGLAAYRFNKLGSLCGAWAWLIGVSFFFGNIWYGLLTLSIIGCQFYYHWHQAPRQTTPVMQQRALGQAILLTLFLQLAVVAIGVVAGWFSLFDKFQGVINWTMPILVVVIGLAAAWLNYSRASDAEEEARYLAEKEHLDA